MNVVRRTTIALVIMTSLFSSTVCASDRPTDQPNKLETVVVTGSLITQTETSAPVFTITAEDVKARGFATLAEVLQQSSYATGSVQGAQFSAGFTPGAQILSMFGMPVGFTKYLIDGKPMGNFPALYNGSDTFNSISSIPTDLVDHIDILPGGQSSLYGSDAIAGVINIVLKKKVDHPTIDYRYGWYTEGGGNSNRLSVADSFHWNRLNLLVGAQVERVRPIWAYDRDISSLYFNSNPGSPAIASRDFMIGSGTGRGYLFTDPNNCANVANLFDGGEGKQYRRGSGSYCGSFNSPGYRTIGNDSKSANVYTHATYELNDQIQLYGDALFNWSRQKYTSGPSYMWWSSQADLGYVYDPKLKDYVALQRVFTPEEVGGFDRLMTRQYERSFMTTLGAQGMVGASWNWDLGFTHSEDHLTTSSFVRWSDKIDHWFETNVLGPQLGWKGSYPVYNINYDQFYRPISRTDFDSFTGRVSTEAKTWDNMLRSQLTNSSLFAFPGGGDVGIAVVVEGGGQGWNYVPDPRLLAGNVWGSTDVQGSGHRSRYAATTEFRAPVLSWLTFDISGRYDAYKVDRQTVDHKTYNLGIELRPFETLLLRGKYGTAFKAPSLSDQFQGKSGYYSAVPDYLNCGRLGYTPDQITSCTPFKYNYSQFFGVQSGNTELNPITAKVWSYGLVWAPVDRIKFSIDYLHWNIRNEVNQENANTLSLIEYQCDTGVYDKSSPTCQNAYHKIIRGTSLTPGLLGDIQQINTPKVNVSREQVNALTAEWTYVVPTKTYGTFAFNTSYSDVMKHTYQAYPGDATIDLLRRPDWSTEFKTKVNGSVTWITPSERWTTTAYFNRYGSTPNYKATLYTDYSKPGTGKVAPWIIYNASVAYKMNDQLGLSLMVNNVFNKMPSKDDTYPGTSGTPWNMFDYNVYGRAIYLEADYKF